MSHQRVDGVEFSMRPLTAYDFPAIASNASRLVWRKAALDPCLWLRDTGSWKARKAVLDPCLWCRDTLPWKSRLWVLEMRHYASMLLRLCAIIALLLPLALEYLADAAMPSGYIDPNELIE